MKFKNFDLVSYDDEHMIRCDGCGQVDCECSSKSRDDDEKSAESRVDF